jgi:hypothetical protein
MSFDAMHRTAFTSKVDQYDKAQLMISTKITRQAQNDEKRLRQDMALLTLRLQPPGYRTEKDIRAISEWLLKDRVIQGVHSLHTIYMRKLCQEIQVSVKAHTRRRQTHNESTNRFMF